MPRKRLDNMTEPELRELAPVADDEWLAAIDPLIDPSDCRHGCNGDCITSGSERCDFTCHEARCENCTAPARHWLDTGWFCSPECYGEYGLQLIQGLRQ